jgi:hypothetical protein
VTDASTGYPIPRATVSTARLSATTASDGSYTLAGMPTGPVSVTVSAYGYRPQTRST